jgi:uncharacterized membrane protein
MAVDEITMYSKARIFRHPIHPMLIAFPVACYVGTVVGFALFIANGGIFWFNLAIALSVVGAGTALIAAIPGAVDLFFGVPKGSTAKMVGMVHAAINLAAAGLMIAVAALYFSDWGLLGRDARLGLTLSSAAVLCTFIAGWLGWMLVQTYHIGIRLTPAQTADEEAVQYPRLVPPSHRRAA